MPGRRLDEETKFYRAQVGELVWCWRQEWGMKQEELAKKAGISRSFLAMLESGKAGASHTTLKSLAAALGVSLADLTPKEGTAKL